jgi:hypothetical protein
MCRSYWIRTWAMFLSIDSSKYHSWIHRQWISMDGQAFVRRVSSTSNLRTCFYVSFDCISRFIQWKYISILFVWWTDRPTSIDYHWPTRNECQRSTRLLYNESIANKSAVDRSTVWIHGELLFESLCIVMLLFRCEQYVANRWIIRKFNDYFIRDANHTIDKS